MTDTQFDFNAKVNSLGTQRSGKGWVMDLNWQLPDSKYDLKLYGQKDEDIQGLSIGAVRHFTIVRGNLKKDKNGDYTTDYFWELAKVGSAEDLPFQQYPQNGPESHRERSFDQPAPAALGMCQNNAVDLLRYGFISMEEGDDLTKFLWEWRDRLYSEVASRPYLGPHGCYEHGVQRVQGKSGAWGHRQDNGWCMDDGSDPLPELFDTEVEEEQEVLDF